MYHVNVFALSFLLFAVNAIAQTPDQEWELENGYDDDLLYLQELVNYSQGLDWQLDWERRQFADNGLRVNMGSATAKELLVVAQLNVNQELNEKWRFQGRFFRNETTRTPNKDDQMFVGLERVIHKSSSAFFMVTPHYDKEFMDLYTGYTFYRQNRQQYVRVGVLLEDLAYANKNHLGGNLEQRPLAVQWAVRLGTEKWTVFSEGKIGTGFERRFPDAEESPELSEHDRQENTARLKFTGTASSGDTWSVWVDWREFNERKLFRQPNFDYDYTNTQLDFAAEFIKTIRDQHRLRFLTHYVKQEAQSRGFNEHDYDRTDVLGGAFYEYLWPMNQLILGFAFGFPEIKFQTVDNSRDFGLDAYRDKLIIGWRHNFSTDAGVVVSASHPMTTGGFGGAHVRYQMFF